MLQSETTHNNRKDRANAWKSKTSKPHANAKLGFAVDDYVEITDGENKGKKGKVTDCLEGGIYLIALSAGGVIKSVSGKCLKLIR